MPVVITKQSAYPKVNEKQSGGKSHAIPVNQSVATQAKKSKYTFPIEPSVNSSAAVNGQLVHFDLEPNYCGRVEDMYFRIKVSSTTQLTVCPGAYLIREWYVKPRRGSGEELVRWYPEDMIEFMYALPEYERRRWQKMNWFYNQELESEGVNKFTDCQNIILEANTPRYIYMPVPWAPVHQGAIDMNHIKHCIRFYMRFETASNWVVSGTSANLSVDAIDLIVDSPYEMPFDEAARMNYQKKQPHAYMYLDRDRILYTDKTLNASTEVKFSLDSLNNQKSAFLRVQIKDTTNPVGRNLFNWVPVTQDSTIDIEEHAGKSLLGRGTALLEDELYELYSKMTQSKPLKGLYYIPFTEDLKGSYNGEIKGYHQFKSSNEQLVVNFPAASTQEVHTINVDSAATAGSYSIGYDGRQTDCELYNAAVGTVKANLEALKPLASRNYTVTLNQNLDAGDVTITFGERDGKVSDEIGKPYLIPQSTFAGVTTIDYEVTTPGKSGWSSGNLYSTYIDSCYYRKLVIDEEGNIDVITL